MWRARVGVSGGMLPREIMCLLAHFACSLILFQKHHFFTGKILKLMGKMNFDVISSNRFLNELVD